MPPEPPEPRRPPARRAADTAAKRLARRYGDAVRAADRKVAETVVDDALASGLSPLAVQTRVIQPAMVRVGELWERAAITTADEHLATAITHQALLRLLEGLRVARPASRPRVLLAAVQGQHHVLGLRMVADVLEGAGFDVLYLGADVPVESLRAFAAERRPAVVGLAYGMVGDVGALAESVCALHETCPDARLMLGGPAVPIGLRDAAYPWVPSSETVLQTVDALLAGPPQPLSPLMGQLRPRTDRPRRSLVPADGGGDTLVGELAAAAADATDVARHYVHLAAQYRDLALIDPVTDLANRRAFDDKLHAAATTSALLVIDVDKFKAVNDGEGHHAGDRLLRRVGEAVASSIRPGDFAARIGGDEFAVILRNASAEVAGRVGERVLRAVAQATGGAVTVSVGAAGVRSDPRAALLSADQALYEAKEAGRARVAIAEESGDARAPAPRRSPDAHEPSLARS